MNYNEINNMIPAEKEKKGFPLLVLLILGLIIIGIAIYTNNANNQIEESLSATQVQDEIVTSEQQENPQEKDSLDSEMDAELKSILNSDIESDMAKIEQEF